MAAFFNFSYPVSFRRRARQQIGLVALLVIGVAACDAGAFVAPAAENLWRVEVSETEYRFTALDQVAHVTVTMYDDGGDISEGALLWSTSDPSIVTVDTMGTITAKSVGRAFVAVAALCCSAADTVAIDVEQVPAALEVTPTDLSLDVGGVQALVTEVRDAMGHPVEGSSVRFVSQNASVAAVNSQGLVEGRGAGSTLVLVETGDLRAQVRVAIGGQTIEDPTTPPSGAGGFYDGFESGDLSYSANGFSWQSGDPVDDEMAFDGSYSAAFPYPASAPNNTNRELRFHTPDVREVWIEYMLYVPENFFHWENPSGPDNHKFMRFWRDEYGSAKSKVGASFDPEYRTGSGKSNLYLQWKDSDRVLNATGGIPDSYKWADWTNGIQGTWAQIRWHIKQASGPTATDGIIELWCNGELVATTGPIDMWQDGDGGLYNAGYFMGAANSGYDRAITFRMDDVRFYTFDPGWK